MSARPTEVRSPCTIESECTVHVIITRVSKDRLITYNILDHWQYLAANVLHNNQAEFKAIKMT